MKGIFYSGRVMKKRIIIIIILVLLLSTILFSFTSCREKITETTGGSDSGNQNGDNDDNENGSDGNDIGGEDKPYTIVLYVNNKEISSLEHDKENSVFSIKTTLKVGDIVKFLDSESSQLTRYDTPDVFSGTVKIDGEHSFTVKEKEGEKTIFVVVPKAPEPDLPDIPDIPVIDGTHTVYYSNSEHWREVYAYVWNSETNFVKTKWPGEKLSSIGISEYGEKQYSFSSDLLLYDRIIFNDGNGKQTRDLIFSFASSGFYGVDGIFTMNKDNYGKVEYFTLKDEKNLSYTRTKSKKFSVYTPSDYSKSNKYSVLYMFDSQNLYIGADGIEKSHDSYGSWSVDVAVNNLVANKKRGFIIVAIDNTDGYRDSELTMSSDFGTLTNLADNDAFKNGKLDMLGDFIVETLMPWVNSHYSVYGTRETTGIAGSSSGGLASYYLGLRDSNLYGYIGAFSPANGLFTSSDWTRFYAKQDFTSQRPLIYAYCGVGDKSLEDLLLPATKEIKKLTSYGYKAEEIKENYLSNGTHSENYWRIAFMEFASLFSEFCNK